MKKLTIALCTTLLNLTFSHAHEGPGLPPDGHAPIFVMGDHMHKTGEWMVPMIHVHGNGGLAQKV